VNTSQRSDYEAKKWYKEKLMLKSEQMPDPYGVLQEEWVEVANCLVWRCLQLSNIVKGSVHSRVIEGI